MKAIGKAYIVIIEIIVDRGFLVLCILKLQHFRENLFIILRQSLKVYTSCFQLRVREDDLELQIPLSPSAQQPELEAYASTPSFMQIQPRFSCLLASTLQTELYHQSLQVKLFLHNFYFLDVLSSCKVLIIHFKLYQRINAKQYIRLRDVNVYY